MRGSGTLAGPFIGAGVAVLLPEWLEVASSKITSPFLQHLFSYLLVYALIVIIMMAFCPTGVVGLAQRIFTPKRRPHADDKGPSIGGPSIGGPGIGPPTIGATAISAGGKP